MVFAADRAPYAHNPTGFVPQFHGDPMSVSEIGYSPGRRVSAVRAQDNVEARKGYAGLYRFGGTYNPGMFESTLSNKPVSGNYPIYCACSFFAGIQPQTRSQYPAQGYDSFDRVAGVRLDSGGLLFAIRQKTPGEREDGALQPHYPVLRNGVASTTASIRL